MPPPPPFQLGLFTKVWACPSFRNLHFFSAPLFYSPCTNIQSELPRVFQPEGGLAVPASPEEPVHEDEARLMGGGREAGAQPHQGPGQGQGEDCRRSQKDAGRDSTNKEWATGRINMLWSSKICVRLVQLASNSFCHRDTFPYFQFDIL
jgi:hypothetical protein